MHERPPLYAGKYPLIDLLSIFFPAQDQPSPGPPQGLMGCGSYNVCIGDGVHVRSARHQAGNMSHIHHKQGAYRIRNIPQAAKIQGPGIGRCPGHDHFRPVFPGQLQDIIVIDALRIRHNAIGNEMEIFPADIHRAPMGQMAAMGKAHAQDRISWLQQGKVYS